MTTSSSPDFKIVNPDFVPVPANEYRFEHSIVNVGGEDILHVIIPYKGCTQKVRCFFCGVQERPNKSLKVDENLGRVVLERVKQIVGGYSADTLVLYNEGNILRPEEMYQKTILEDIPRLVAQNPKLSAYELECRADDVVKFQESLRTIQSNLEGKKLRIRLGIEYKDDELLLRHRKNLTVAQIQQAADFLNQQRIEWNGYSLLGGLDMTREQARQSAVQTGQFIMDNKARKLSVNGIFITASLKKFENRLYMPDYEDLIFVMRELYRHKEQTGSKILFKIGFEEEEPNTIQKTPFHSDDFSSLEVFHKIQHFDKTQDLHDLV